MKFPKIIGRREMIQAALLGSVTGIVGVLLFILLLNSMDSQFTSSQLDEDMIPVTSQQREDNGFVANEGFTEQFYAKQHGVFSSFEAATEFVYGYASLNTSAVVDIDGTFYVWSGVSTTKEDIVPSDDPPSFTKAFRFSAASCEQDELKNLPSLLKSNDPAKFYFEGVEIPDNIPSDWQTLTFALSSISKDLSVVRMHLLAHYFTENECLKIEF